MEKGSVMGRAKQWGFLLGILAVIGVVLGLRNAKQATMPSGMRQVPEFKLKDREGRVVSMGDFSDRVVIVHFWASWCAPCIPELPEILSAARTLPQDQSGRPIQWVLVSQDESWESANKIISTLSVPAHVVLLLDPEAKVSDQFGTYQFPETYFITRKGEIGAKWIGPQEWSGNWGKGVLEGLEYASRFNELPAPKNPH